MTFPYYWRGLLAAGGLLGACQAPAPPTAPGNSPPPGALLRRQLPARQVLAALALFQQIKEAADAGLHKYRPQAQMDSAFATVRARVAGPLPVLAVPAAG